MAQVRGKRLFWTAHARPTDEEWNALFAKLDRPKHKAAIAKLQKLREAGDSLPTRRAFGNVAWINNELTEIGSSFRISIIGIDPGRSNKKVGMVRVADGVERTSFQATPVEISITRIDVATEPPIDVFEVVLSKHAGVWPETFGSEHDLSVFLRGVSAGVNMMGGRCTSFPSIPSRTTKVMVEKPEDE